MAKNLVIVESPAKAKTLGRYLGGDYDVRASVGHIRDLPKNKLGVDIENDFQPEYKIIENRESVVRDLQKAAKASSSVFLAADPDREGEAICGHLQSVLEDYNSNIFRVLFHEITKSAVKEAFDHIGQLDKGKIKAQQTRRILDRLVGYLISPLLWKKIGRGLSAGRVQSIAVRLICEREQEIRDFVAEEFWTIGANLKVENPPEFKANLVKIDGKKAKIEDEEKAQSIVTDLNALPYRLDDVQVKAKKRNPSPPYITSSLQQDCFRRLRFPVRKTMSVAQKLYEGLEIGDKGLTGLITYMRTDSFRVSDEAVAGVREYIKQTYSEKYLPSTSRVYKNKKKAQDAHEAIRPTSFDCPPEKVESYLTSEEFRLYSMIWKRFVASQMNPAEIEETVFDISAGKYLLKAKGEVIKFDGFLVLSPKKDEIEDEKDEKDEKDNKLLPKALPGEELEFLSLESKQNFTQPPPRYTEGSLVKELEARGIGRPSTYAPIIATIQSRDYVVREKGKFIPTEIGLFVNAYLIKNFPNLMEFKFTANLEEKLDLISEGEQDWLEYLRSYYVLLDKDLKEAGEDEGVRGTGIPLEEKCPDCGKKLVIKSGRFGRFKACSGYPDCTFKESMQKKEVKELDEDCPKCGSKMVMRHGRYGPFVACSNYPECKYIKSDKKDTGIKCPEEDCSGTFVQRKTRKGRIFYGCSRYPKCKHATWDEPVDRPCPECEREFVLKKSPINGQPHFYCGKEGCSYKEDTENEKLWEKKKEE
ncbi:MAG: type I DNA topoisomerase [Candidatus Aminicenantaceae bacterium]